MRHNLLDTISIELSRLGKQVMKFKNFINEPIENGTFVFELWELRMLFGNKTINLNNTNPVVSNKFFKAV